jgi:hypothetical protein
MSEPVRGSVEFGMAPLCPLPLGTKIEDFSHDECNPANVIF